MRKHHSDTFIAPVKGRPNGTRGNHCLVKTKQYARKHIYARKLTIAVEECLTCQAVTNTRQQELFKMMELPNGPWEYLRANCLDHPRARNTYW